jgi:hypothetical protein
MDAAPATQKDIKSATYVLQFDVMYGIKNNDSPVILDASLVT